MLIFILLKTNVRNSYNFVVCLPLFYAQISDKLHLPTSDGKLICILSIFSQLSADFRAVDLSYFCSYYLHPVILYQMSNEKQKHKISKIQRAEK